MKYGIYYAYWEHEWKADYLFYIKKIADLGFDILEIAATPLTEYTDAQLTELKKCAEYYGVELTCGHGPHADQNLASADPDIQKNAKRYYIDLLERLFKLNIHILGGGIYSYWPVDYTMPIDKKADWERSVKNVREVAHVAGECGVSYCLEVLNRFEGYLLNTAAEGAEFVRQVGDTSVKVMLDTFHMNIEEDSFGSAIRTAGKYLGHFHVGECNRKVPGKGRIPWKEVAEALRDINYNGTVVMEPFVLQGGQVGSDIKIWRDISRGASVKDLDNDAVKALSFLKYMAETVR
jgi:D-psicose/D-tagatose/L-ribulose 3-epimerase